MRMINLFTAMTFIFVVSCFTKNTDAGIIWKHGIATKDGRALYIDVNKMDQSVIIVAKSSIEAYKKRNEKVIRAGKISWIYDDFIAVYDTEFDSPSHGILESKIKYQYKIENNAMYIRKGAENWDRLEIRIVDENPPQKKGKFANPIYLIIHLKCKWFENEYEVFGASG